MNLRTIALSAALLAVSPLPGREKSDVIVMKNGDKITCEVKSLSSNTLYISVDYILNTLSVDWTKVDHIESKQLFLVRTQDGTVYTGALSTPATPAGRPFEIEVVEAPESKVTLERAKVVSLGETSASFWQRLLRNHSPTLAALRDCSGLVIRISISLTIPSVAIRSNGCASASQDSSREVRPMAASNGSTGWCDFARPR